MTIPLSVLLAQVDSEISGLDSELAEYRRLRLIKSAVAQYWHDVPVEVTEDITGDGGRYYDVAGLASWVEGLSNILRVQYPAATIADDDMPQWLESHQWEDYWDGATHYLHLPNYSPAATEAIRVLYTTSLPWVASAVVVDIEQPSHGLQVDDYTYYDGDNWLEADDILNATHQVTVVPDSDNFTAALLASDIPTSDFFPLCKLGASMCAQAIAARYSRTNEPAISVDSIRHITRAQEWAMRAKEFLRTYREMLGIPDPSMVPDVTPASATVRWPTAAEGGRRYLFHRRGE